MLSVLKIGGSVLRDAGSYATAAAYLRDRLASAPGERLVVIVSARYGETDALHADAEAITHDPSPDAMDLLWSTGEIRSVARLALNLQRLGVRAVPFNVHQTGLIAERDASRASAGTTVRPLRLLAALTEHRVVIIPGFLGVTTDGTIASLGRGGSDLTAVLLAAAVRADACELIKDVPGYYTADPHLQPGAQPIHELTIERALEMAREGCDLVQYAALASAAAAALPIVVRSMNPAAHVTYVHSRSHHHGVCDQDDSRRPAVGA